MLLSGQRLTAFGMGEKLHEVAVKPEVSGSLAIGSIEIHLGFKRPELGLDAWRFVSIIFMVRGTGACQQ